MSRRGREGRGDKQKQREKEQKNKLLSLALNQGTSLGGRRPQINPAQSTNSCVLMSDDMMWGPDMPVCVCVWVCVCGCCGEEFTV